MNRKIQVKYIYINLRRLVIVVLLILIGLHFFITLKNRSKTNTCASSDQSSCYEPVPSLKKSDAECTKYDFKTNSSNVTYTSLPIYDFFIFNGEFDTLEIRLHELYNYVTLFLIAESQDTLSGKEKPLYLEENWSKFSRYNDKIRRIEIQLVRNVTDPWSNERRMRNEGLRLALSIIKDEKYILLTSDADEIPKAHFMNALANCPLPDSFPPSILDCHFYYYSYEFRSKTHIYHGVTIHLIHSNPSNLPTSDSLRRGKFDFHCFPSTCYHCTWCFNQLKDVRRKMASYSHTEHNEIKFRSREHILRRYRYGTDLFDRQGEEYIYINNNTDLPELVKSQPERFMYMTKRSKMYNAGFIDAEM